MTDDRLPLAELLAKAGDGDFLRSVAEAVVQLLMETDVEGLIGAGRHERTGERTTYRNGYRDRSLSSASFPTKRRSSASSGPCCWSRTTSGRPRTATCRPSRWPNWHRQRLRSFHHRLPP